MNKHTLMKFAVLPAVLIALCLGFYGVYLVGTLLGSMGPMPPQVALGVSTVTSIAGMAIGYAGLRHLPSTSLEGSDSWLEVVASVIIGVGVSVVAILSLSVIHAIPTWISQLWLLPSVVFGGLGVMFGGLLTLIGIFELSNKVSQHVAS